jgi:hypothetical protein
MPDGFNIDFSDIDQLAADIAEVPKKAGPKIRQAVEVTSRHIKDAWRDKLTGSEHLPGLPYAVDYDITTFQGFGASVIKSEIGFDKDRPQGALGNISEYGSINNPPRGYGLAALQENIADFEKGLGIAIEPEL